MPLAASAWTRRWPNSRKSAPAWRICSDRSGRPTGRLATWNTPMSEPSTSATGSAGVRFRAAVAAESPLQVVGAITAYAGLMAGRVGYRALYLSGGGVAANSLGMPDLGISTMEDVLTDARRIVEATGLPLLVVIDTVIAEERRLACEVI